MPVMLPPPTALLLQASQVRHRHDFAGALVATRFDKLAVRYEATVHIVAISEWR
ncbi:hypothetical protein RM555_06405 [Micromonospora sp. DSM 115977]|uniref:Uncharacterized protein n=1 Tax=Micromonospora reichwaldensis TaxID=3075516 RepID=A0ABU2WU54_9ACTN|nr:hypothetical protein [Micromonospora sp. DSM 115977]MDT0528622.1 hypothetical protein [Micromonospora sp. DSM 115977]